MTEHFLEVPYKTKRLAAGRACGRVGLRLLATLAPAALALAGCGGGTVTGKADGADLATSGEVVDSVSEVRLAIDETLEEDLGLVVDVKEVRWPELGELSGDSDPWCQEGHFTCPCNQNSDCLSGFCVETPEGLRCSEACVDECAAPGWECLLVQGSCPDCVWICVQPYPRLCRPCLESSQCETLSGTASELCVSYGDAGFFCGGGCDQDSDCPDGYACKEVTSIEGADVEQCVRAEGECPCSPLSEGLWTTCFVTNSFGSCPGQRFCEGSELTDCEGPAAAEEECNQLDDDCDGLTDEELGAVPCGTGECEHEVPACVDGEPGECDPLTGQGEEECNGLDDDCDGDTDEEAQVPDDDNPCTDDWCNEATGEVEHFFNQEACDDKDPCTTQDEC